MRSRKQMTPYVIDGKKREQYIYLLLFFIIFSFALGYTLGYLSGIPAEIEETVTLNQKTVPAAVKPHSIQTDNVDDNSEVSKPDDKPVEKTPLKEQTSANTQHTEATKVKAKPVPVATPVKPKSPPQSTSSIQPLKSKSKPISTTPRPTPQITIPKVVTEQQQQGNSTQATTTAKKVDTASESQDKDPTQYLVQVGLFSSMGNAASFVEQLEKSGFKAFYEGFTSTSGEEKYNVRLGPFAEKSIAQEKMAEFQKLHDISAYILTHE